MKGHKLTNGDGYCYCKNPEIHTNLESHKELKGCCDKCISGFTGSPLPDICVSCPCHQSSKEDKCNECQFEEGHSFGCSKHKRNIPKDPSTWEERFAERFCDGVMDGKDTDLVITEDIKSFIHKEIVRTRVEERTKPSFMDGFEAGKSQALQEVVELIEGIKVKSTRNNQLLADVKEAIVKLMV